MGPLMRLSMFLALPLCVALTLFTGCGDDGDTGDTRTTAGPDDNTETDSSDAAAYTTAQPVQF